MSNKGYGSVSEYTGIGYGAMGIAIRCSGIKCTSSSIGYGSVSECSVICYGSVGIAIKC